MQRENKMKMKILKVIVLLLSIVFLCSFDKKDSKNENISLQNTEKNTYSGEEKTNSWGLVSEAEDELSGIYESFVGALPDGAPKSTDELSGFLGVEKTLAWISSFLSSRESVGVLLVFLSAALLFSISELLLK